MNLPVRALLFLLAAAVWSAASAAPPSVRAVVRADRTNLRAQPSMDAEVLASLKRGDVVEVLGEQTIAGKKEAWSRIVLPSSVMVWAHSPGVDKSGRVRQAKLNFRAGPGKNYSVLGSLRQGDSVVIIRDFDGWIQIAPPDDAVAYVASRLLTTPAEFAAQNPSPAEVAAPKLEPSPVVPRTTPPSPPVTTPPPPRATFIPAGEPTPSPNPTVAAPSPTTAVPQELPASSAQIPPPEPPPSTTPEVVPQVAPAPAVQEPVPAENPAPTTAKPSLPLGSPRAQQASELPAGPKYPVLISDPEPGRQQPGDTVPEPRRVTREGVVHRTASVQAPTDFELRNGFYNEGVLDYLFFEPQTDLKKFQGKRVRVEGEEYLDSRWRTPVLKAQSVELVP